MDQFNKGDAKCRDCRREYRKEYYAKNAEAEQLAFAMWREANKERRNEWKRIYAQNTPEEEKRRQNELKRIATHKRTYGPEWGVLNLELLQVKKELRQESPTAEQERSKRRTESGEYRDYYRRKRANSKGNP